MACTSLDSASRKLSVTAFSGLVMEAPHRTQPRHHPQMDNNQYNKDPRYGYLGNPTISMKNLAVAQAKWRSLWRSQVRQSPP